MTDYGGCTLAGISPVHCCVQIGITSELISKGKYAELFSARSFTAEEDAYFGRGAMAVRMSDCHRRSWCLYPRGGLSEHIAIEVFRFHPRRRVVRKPEYFVTACAIKSACLKAGWMRWTSDCFLALN